MLVPEEHLTHIVTLPGEPAKRAFNVFLDCWEQGVLLRTTGDTVALSPPLIIDKAPIANAPIVHGMRRPIPSSWLTCVL